MDIDLLKTLEPFFKQSKEIHYKKGHTIIHPEDNVGHIYFIEKGYVRFYSISEDGKEFTFLIYKPGYIFPIIYTFLGNKTKYYFEALTPVVLRRSPKETFNKLIAEKPELLYPVTKELIVRYDEMLERLEDMAFDNAESKVKSILHLLGVQFGRKEGKKTVFKFPLIHKDIASMTGMTRETVSIEMKKLEQRKLIQYKKKTHYD